MVTVHDVIPDIAVSDIDAAIGFCECSILLKCSKYLNIDNN